MPLLLRSSFLLLVVRPGAPSSVLAPSSDAPSSVLAPSSDALSTNDIHNELMDHHFRDQDHQSPIGPGFCVCVP